MAVPNLLLFDTTRRDAFAFFLPPRSFFCPKKDKDWPFPRQNVFLFAFLPFFPSLSKLFVVMMLSFPLRSLFPLWRHLV